MNILVFGASRGIGRVFADSAAEQGHKVFVFARTWQEKNSAEKPIFIQSDFEDTENLEKQVSSLCAELKQVDALVFCQKYRKNENSWEGEIKVSLTATKTAIETAASYMSGGSVVVISSNAAHFVAPEQPVSYHMAKAALEQMVRFYAVRYGEQGIRFNAVSPAVTLKPENTDFYKNSHGLTSAISSVVPLGRMGTADDVAKAVMFLLESGFITGQILAVDGGLSLRTQESIARDFFSRGNAG